jgi:hypothetical protein
MAVFSAEFFKIGQAVDIHIHAQAYRFFNFAESDTVAGV